MYVISEYMIPVEYDAFILRVLILKGAKLLFADFNSAISF